MYFLFFTPMWCQFSNNFFVLFCSFSLPSICLQIVKHKLTFMTKMRGNGFFLLTGYYWSFSMCCQSWICQIAGLVWHVVHPSSSCELWGRSPADQSNICLKRHFNSDSDSIRDEQPGSKPNRSVCLSVCQDCNESVESCLSLIASSTTQKFHPRKER